MKPLFWLSRSAVVASQVVESNNGLLSLLGVVVGAHMVSIHTSYYLLGLLTDIL